MKVFSKMISYILILQLILLAMHAYAAAESAGSGYWELVEIKTAPSPQEIDQRNSNSINYTTSAVNIDSLAGSGIDRVAVGVEVRDRLKYDVKLNFKALPERLESGQELSIQFSNVVNYEVVGSVPNGWAYWGTQTVQVYNELDPQAPQYYHEWKTEMYGDTYSSEDNVSFDFVFGDGDKMIAESGGNPDNFRKSFTISYWATNMVGTYLELFYLWHSGTAAMPTAEPAPPPLERTIDLNCIITDAQYKNMQGLPVTAELIDLVDLTQTAQRSIALITNSQGMVRTTVSVPEQMELPALRLTTSLNSVDKDNNVLFRIIDDADSISRDKKAMTISTTIILTPDELELLNSGVIIMKNVGLSFANLIGYGTWDYLGSPCEIGLEPSISVVLTDPRVFEDGSGNSRSTAALTAQRRMADASIFYTTMYDAYMLASDELEEEEQMHTTVVYVRLRSSNAEDADMQSSHFDPRDVTIHLTNIDSFPDDRGIFTILHESGHAVDYITNEFEFRTPLDTDYDTDYHGGFLNRDMNGSFTEGFATAYAGFVKKYYDYPAPQVLDFIDLGVPSPYFVYHNNGTDEELAVAAFLYNADEALGGIGNTWLALGPDRAYFSDYYDAIITRARDDTHLPDHTPTTLRELALQLGLYAIPYEGNGVYDEGEPYVDSNDNGVWNPGETYHDLIFDWTTNDAGYTVFSGYQDPEQWNEQKDSVVTGTASDYARAGIRKTTAWPKTGYLAVQGAAPVDYVLVTLRPENGPTTTALRNALCGMVFMFDPLKYSEGTVTVQIPGGDVIYESDLATLAQRAISAAPSEPLGLSYVSLEQFAGDDVIPVPTYGAADATGTIHRETLSQIDIDMMVAERLAHKDEEPADEIDIPGSGSGYSSPGSWDYNYEKEPGGGFIIIVVIAVALAVIILIASRKRKGKVRQTNTKSAAAAAPKAKVATAKTPRPAAAAHKVASTVGKSCPVCGNAVSATAKFCKKCGAKIGLAGSTSSFCPGCGAAVPEGSKFCQSCGKKLV